MAVASESNVFEPTRLEKTILSELHQKTSLEFRRLGGIDTQDKKVADAVLPILRDWVERLHADPRHRHAVYTLFKSRHAYGYLEDILTWWTTEHDTLGLSSLTQIIAELLKCADAPRVWALCKTLPPRPFKYMLLSKLAACPTVEEEVKNVLLKALATDELRAGDLSYIAQVNDPRIREAFREKVNSPDKHVRTIAKRVVAHGKPLPIAVAYSPLPPPLHSEIFSTEIDFANTANFIAKLAKDYGIKVPSSIRRGMFLSSVDVDRWLVAKLTTVDGKQLQLWFRMEDIDTVQIALTEPRKPASLQ